MIDLPSPPYRVGLIGAGSVGTAVADLLRERGHEIVGVASRSQASSEAAATRLSARSVAPQELRQANVLLVGTPASAIAEAASAVGPADGTAVVHFAGVVGAADLQRTIGADATACALHPVQACPNVDIAIRRLPGSAWGITSRAEASDWCHRFVQRELDGGPVDVSEEQRPAWHAAAVITSNGLAALLARGEQVLAALGIAEPHRVLGPLAVGTATNALEGGGGAATLTGPAVRGEVDTIAAHIDALEALSPTLRGIYQEVSRSILTAASEAGRRTEEDSAAIIRALQVHP